MNCSVRSRSFSEINPTLAQILLALPAPAGFHQVFGFDLLLLGCLNNIWSMGDRFPSFFVN